MKLNEAEKKIFNELINSFIKKHGRDVLKDVYRLHRALDNQLFIKNYPAADIFKKLLIEDMQTVYKGMPAQEIANIEGVSKRRIFNYYSHIYKIKKTKTLNSGSKRKSNKVQNSHLR